MDFFEGLTTSLVNQGPLVLVLSAAIYFLRKDMKEKDKISREDQAKKEAEYKEQLENKEEQHRADIRELININKEASKENSDKVSKALDGVTAALNEQSKKTDDQSVVFKGLSDNLYANLVIKNKSL